MNAGIRFLTAAVMALASQAALSISVPVIQLPVIAPTTCLSNSDCNDGKFCDGQELCVNHLCKAATTPACKDGQVCNETADRCLDAHCANPDQDGDGVSSIECGGTDCDDADPHRYPGNPEICDPVNPMHDEDCDPQTIGERDQDHDGYTDSICGNVQPGNTQLNGNDCNDRVATIHPTEAEVCNHIDDDCNGAIDDGVQVALYPDNDGDGYGAFGSTPIMGCIGDPKTSLVNTDCDDQNPYVHPGVLTCGGPFSRAATLCNAKGQNELVYCDAQVGGGGCMPQPGGTGICVPSKAFSPKSMEMEQ